MHHALDRVGLPRALELLLVGLDADKDRDRQLVHDEVREDIQDQQRLVARLPLGRVERVALVPEEFAVAQERARGLLPAHDAAPLVVELREVAPGVNDVLPVLAEQRFRRRAHAQTLLERLAAADRHPRALGRKALDVVLLLLQEAFGDQHREVDVFVPRLLKAAVQLPLDVFPDRVAVGPVNEHALDRRIVDQLRLFADVGIPLREVGVARRDRFHSLLLCHIVSPFQLVLSESVLYVVSGKMSRLARALANARECDRLIAV